VSMLDLENNTTLASLYIIYYVRIELTGQKKHTRALSSPFYSMFLYMSLICLRSIPMCVHEYTLERR